VTHRGESENQGNVEAALQSLIPYKGAGARFQQFRSACLNNSSQMVKKSVNYCSTRREQEAKGDSSNIAHFRQLEEEELSKEKKGMGPLFDRGGVHPIQEKKRILVRDGVERDVRKNN